MEKTLNMSKCQEHSNENSTPEGDKNSKELYSIWSW